ncbi:MAG: hypothetical protein GY797_15795 [Deltaproteobacteria bacterium]|nr:hypothetical protein [Deltaproteobacteria bacterium]
MTDQKTTLLKLNKNLNILQEREAKYGGQSPLALLNQIEDHRRAIYLTEQAIIGDITENDWQIRMQPLLLDLDEFRSQSRKDDVQKLIGIKARRLQKLKEVNASEGINTPPEIIMEIEDIEAELEQLQAELLELKYSRVDEETENVDQIINQAVNSGARMLDLSFKHLEAFPLGIIRLANLEILDLSFNQLTTLPPEIKKLTNIKTLNFRSNQLRVLPQEIGTLSKLTGLDLRTNRLTALPKEIAQLTNLETLDLRTNLLPVPPEILKRANEPNEIINFYLNSSQSSVEKRPLNEAKMLIVGEGEVGKTSLMNRLIADHFNPNETKTEGINIQRYHMMVG